MPDVCRYCCKSPKLSGDNFPAIRRSERRAAIFIASVALARSLTSLSSGDEVPHIFTRKSRLQPGEFWITSAKRLLHQYLPIADLSRCSKMHPRRHLRLLDDLVGAREQRCRHFAPECLRGLKVDNELILGRLLHRQLARLAAFQNTIHIMCGTAVLLRDIGAIAHEAAIINK